MRCADGDYKWIVSRGKVVERDATGHPVRAVGTHTDLTARKALELRLRQANEELRAIFDSAPVGIALIRDRVVLRCNRALERTLGSGEGGLDGLPTRSWFPDEDAWRSVGAAIEEAVAKAVQETGAASPKDMGRVMKAAMAALARPPSGRRPRPAGLGAYRSCPAAARADPAPVPSAGWRASTQPPPAPP